jgi:Leucine-rich repeat (LRR) protein
LDSQLHEVDIGHVVEVPTTVSTNSMNNPPATRTPTNRLNGDGNADDAQSHYTNGTGASTKDGAESLASYESSDAGGTRSTMTGSTAGGLFYGGGKSSGNRSNGGGVLFGKSSSLIFPTGVEQPTGSDGAGGSVNVKRHKINILLDQCETVRFPFKKKLMLNALGLTAADIPVKDLYGTNLGNTLHKLNLAGNRLSTIPPKLVTCLPTLKTLDLSQCELHQLPERWNLPQLKRLNLSHNRLTDFPEEVRESEETALGNLQSTIPHSFSSFFFRVCWKALQSFPS